MPGSMVSSRSAVASPWRTAGKAQATERNTAAGGSADDVPPTLANPLRDERLLRLRDVLTVVGLSRAHVYHLVKNGLFPRPIALGSNCARWVQSEVQAWVADRIGRARDTDSAIRRL